MTRYFTIAEARDHLSEVVRLAEDEGAIELTRRGKPVAMVISAREYLGCDKSPGRAVRL